MPAPSRTLISLTDAADRLGVHVRTLRRYISQGRITGHRVGPRLVKLDAAEVDNFARPIPTWSGR